jgi:short-subunit dehydrogenase
VDTIYSVLPHLKISSGRLVVVSSIFGRVGAPASSAYCASKFALCGLLESLDYELRDCGVSVTGIHPGIVASSIRMVDNEGQFDATKADPAPRFLLMPADKAAYRMMMGIYRRRFDVVVTSHAKLAVGVNRLLPRLFRFGLRRLSKGQIAKIQKLKRG